LGSDLAVNTEFALPVNSFVKDRLDIESLVEKLGNGKKSARVLKTSAKIGKTRQNSANIKKYIIYSFFFKILNIFQYIKQQQHHINRQAHKYGERTDIYYIVDAKQKPIHQSHY
jgi:hypothetical protein